MTKSKEKRIPRMVLLDNAHLIRKIFAAAFDGRTLRGEVCTFEVNKYDGSVAIKVGEIAILTSAGFASPEHIGHGWFKEVNGAPVYDREKSLSNVNGLVRSGVLKVCG